MSDFPPGSSTAANAKSPAYADALLRARQVSINIIIHEDITAFSKTFITSN